MNLTYRQKQQLLKSYRNDGYELEVKLNEKGDVLDLEIARIEALMDDSATVETDIALEDITLEQLEEDAARYEAILSTTPTDVWDMEVETQETEVEPVASTYQYCLPMVQELALEATEVSEMTNVSSEVVEPVNANFREGSALVFLMQPLAMFLGAFIVASVWLIIQSCISLKPVIVFTLRQLDRGLTGILEGLVMIIEYLFGDTHINGYSEEMIEIAHFIN